MKKWHKKDSRDAKFVAGAKQMTLMAQVAIADHLQAGEDASSPYYTEFVNPIMKFLQVVAEGRVPYASRGFWNRTEKQEREGAGSDFFLEFHEFLAKHRDVTYVHDREKHSPGRRLRDSSWENRDLWWAQEALLQAIVMYMRERKITTYLYYTK